MAGYAYARLRFPFRTPLFYVTIFGLLVPFFAYMIPPYYQMRLMGLLNTLVGTDLVLASTSMALGTFFMRAFFIDLPVELEQAARIDNCAEWQVFWYVMFPFVRSGAAALGVFTFIQNWNNFLVPLLFLPNGNYDPVTLGLYILETARINNDGPVSGGLYNNRGARYRSFYLHSAPFDTWVQRRRRQGVKPVPWTRQETPYGTSCTLCRAI